MNMIPFVLLLVLAVNGTACGGAEKPNAGAAATGGAESASPLAADAPGSDSKPTPPAPAQATPPAIALAPGDRGPVVARVNGTPIYKIDYDSALANFMQSNQLGPDTPEEQKKEAQKVVMDGLIGSELLYQKARLIPIEIPQADVDKAIAQTKTGMGEEGFKSELQRRGMSEKDLENLVKQNLMVQKMIKEQVVNTVTVSDADLKTFYDEHQKDMAKPEDVEASHILVRSNPSDPAEKKTAARQKIDLALKRVKAGEDFGQMAKEYSEDGSAANGGSLGPIHRGQTVPAFEETAFKLGVGQVSDVVESQFGFHIIKVTAKHPSGVAAFDEVKARIGEFLKQQKSRDAIEKTVAGLRSEAKIEIL